MPIKYYLFGLLNYQQGGGGAIIKSFCQIE